MFQRRCTVWLQRASLFLSLSLLLVAAGCGGGSTGITTTQKTLSSIAVAPLAGSIVVGATQPFTATGTYSDGSTAAITTATWTSATASVATISAAGLATGVAVGSTSVTATLSGVTGTATLAVTAAPAPTLTSIAVAPLAGSIAVGATQQFTATGTYSDGSTAAITTATWTTATASVATITTAGLATGLAAGSTTVTATLSGVSGTAMLTVTAPPITKTLMSIMVTPLAGSVAVGATQQFAATATYSDGTTTNVTTQATWATTNAAIATVNAAGLTTGVAAGSTSVTATLTGISGTATLTVTAASQTLTSIALTPNPATIAMGATQQFTATATYSDHSTADVTASVTWTAANMSVATIDGAGLATGVASGSTTITATLNAITGTAPLSVTIVAGTGVNIPTWHADNNRSGLNAAEQSLTPSNVTSSTFGKLFSYLLDGYAYAEPLLMSNVTIAGKTHNVLYVATENDSVYAFDADNYGTGASLWHTSLLKTGETPQTTAVIKPNQGVTGTPVIDPSTNTMYVVSAQTMGGVGTFRLNALDITTGLQKTGSPVTITASVPGTNASGNGSTVTLTTACLQRPALLLENGIVYVGIGGCPTGWMMAYTALTASSTTMTQTAVFNASPNLNGEGPYASAGGIWMGSGGPVGDSAGNIYVATGNGPWDGSTAWGDTVLKFNSSLAVQSYFTPQDEAYMNCADSDLGAGGLLLIPGSTPGSSEVIAGGKMGLLYLLNTDQLGYTPVANGTTPPMLSDATAATQTLYFESDVLTPYTAMCTDTITYPYQTSAHTAKINSYENFGTAAYFNGSVYLGVTPTAPNVPAGVRQFTYSGGVLAIAGAYPADYTTPSVGASSYGTTPFISANGATDGIVWMIDHGDPLQESGTTTNATLRAYNATDLNTQLYNSSTNAADTPGYGIKFTSPIVGNGKVYISTGHALTTATTGPLGEIDVYGLH